MESQPLVSVVICTYNRRDSLLDCLDSLVSQSYSPYEVIVVDDGSSDGTGDLVKIMMQKYPTLKYIFQQNKGPPSARNFGISNSCGELICFTDDDCIVDHDWLKRLVEVYVDESIGGVGGKIRNYTPNGGPKTLVERFMEKTGILHQKDVETFLISANASYRRDVLEALNGFDPELRHGEDVDIGIRVRMTGRILKYAPDAMVFHKNRQTMVDLMRQFYGYGLGYVMLHMKYVCHFNPSIIIFRRCCSIALNIVKIPFRLLGVFFTEDIMLSVYEPLIMVSILSAEVVGMMYGCLFARLYAGQKITTALDFL